MKKKKLFSPKRLPIQITASNLTLARIARNASPSLLCCMKDLFLSSKWTLKDIEAEIGIREQDIDKVLDALELEKQLPSWGIPSRDSVGPTISETQKRWSEMQLRLMTQIKKKLKVRHLKKWTGTKSEFAQKVKDEYHINGKRYKDLMNCNKVMFNRFSFPNFPGWTEKKCYDYIKHLRR